MDAVIQTVIAKAGRYVYACGGARAEVWRATSGRQFRWRWRVWLVLGGAKIAGGIATTKEVAGREAFQFLRGSAS